MYKAKVAGTGELFEAENFKPVYDASLLAVIEALKGNDPETVTIEVNGRAKYRITGTKWFYNKEFIGKSVCVTRLTDWSSLTIKAFFKEGCMI